MSKTLLEESHEQHVLPSHLQHILVSDGDGDGQTLVDFAAKIAVPTLAEVTLCCRADNAPHTERSSPSISSAAVLRAMGLTVFEQPAVGSQIQQILLADRSRSIDLMVMTEGSPQLESVCWRPSDSIRVARVMQRPVIAFGPLAFGPRGKTTSQGCVVAAVSMGESSHQIVHASKLMGDLLKQPLTVLHAVDLAHEFSRPDNLASVECGCRLLGDWISRTGAAVSAKISYGPVGEALPRFATFSSASLIVIGLDMEEEGKEAQHSDALRQLILSTAPCPVLLLPTFHAGRDRSQHRTARPPLKARLFVARKSWDCGVN
jgi:hypothetical protein